MPSDSTSFFYGAGAIIVGMLLDRILCTFSLKKFSALLSLLVRARISLKGQQRIEAVEEAPEEPVRPAMLASEALAAGLVPPPPTSHPILPGFGGNEVLSLSQVEADNIAGTWDAVNRRALQSNPFYEESWMNI